MAEKGTEYKQRLTIVIETVMGEEEITSYRTWSTEKLAERIAEVKKDFASSIGCEIDEVVSFELEVIEGEDD